MADSSIRTIANDAATTSPAVTSNAPSTTPNGEAGTAAPTNATTTATAPAASSSSSSATPSTRPNYVAQTVNDLKALCRARGLTVSGTKMLLVARLEAYDKDPMSVMKGRKRTRDEFDVSGALNTTPITPTSTQQTVPINQIWLQQCVDRWGLLPPYDLGVTENEWQSYFVERKTLEDTLENAHRESLDDDPAKHEAEERMLRNIIFGIKGQASSSTDLGTSNPQSGTNQTAEIPTNPASAGNSDMTPAETVASQTAAAAETTTTATATAASEPVEAAPAAAGASSSSSSSTVPAPPAAAAGSSSSSSSAGPTASKESEELPSTLFPDEEERTTYIINLQKEIRAKIVRCVLGCKQIKQELRTQLANTLGNSVYIISGYTNWEDEEDPRTIEIGTRIYSAVGNGKSVDCSYYYHFRPRNLFTEHSSDLRANIRFPSSCGKATPWRCAANHFEGVRIMAMEFNDRTHNMKRHTTGGVHVKPFMDVLLGGKDMVSARKAFNILLHGAGVGHQYEHSISWLYRVVKRKTRLHKLEETSDDADPGDGHSSNKPYYSDPGSGSDDEDFYGIPRKRGRGRASGDCIVS